MASTWPLVALASIASFISIWPIEHSKKLDVERVLGPTVYVNPPNDNVGSGTVIASIFDGATNTYKTYFITNFHVVVSRNESGVVTKVWDEIDADTFTYHERQALTVEHNNATLVKKDEKLDLALFVMKDRIEQYPYVAPLGENPDILDKVSVVSCPNANKATLTEGNVSGYEVVEGQTVIRSTAQFYSGSSGGALYDAEWRLIGVTMSYEYVQLSSGDTVPITFLEFAVPISDVREFLADTPIASVL